MIAQILSISPVIHSRQIRHSLLLSDLLSPDAVFQVQSPQGGHGDALVSEFAMKEPGSPFERIACPLLQSLIACEEVDVLLFELGLISLTRSPLGLYSISTNMLNSVVRDAKCLRDLCVGDIPRRVD